MSHVPAITVVEVDTQPGAYDFQRQRIVIDHPQHGRLLLSEGWGGSEVQGQCYRWCQGSVHRIQAEDTVASLRATSWNECMTGLDAVDLCVDDARPPLEWAESTIERMAERALT